MTEAELEGLSLSPDAVEAVRKEDESVGSTRKRGHDPAFLFVEAGASGARAVVHAVRDILAPVHLRPAFDTFLPHISWPFSTAALTLPL